MSKFSTDSKSDILVHLAMMLAIILVAFFAFFFLYLPWSTNHGESVAVPNLKGLTLEAAEDLLDAKNLDYEVSDSIFVPGMNPLNIISNYPKTGANVKSGRKIYLTVAAISAPLVKVPNLIGRSSSSAKNQLLSAGLIAGEEEKIPALEENTVLKVKLGARELQPGEDIPKGSKITLVVGDGYSNLMMDAPSVIGLPQDEADIKLSGSGLTIGSIIAEPSEEPAGTVIKQKPAAGEKVKNGSSINIWVAAGNEIQTENN